jgi:hypothetical protein
MRPFAGRDRVVRIDTGVWSTVSVDTDPFSCPQRDAFASKQEAGILYDPSQLREHLTGDEVLMHGRDWMVLEAMLLRCDPRLFAFLDAASAALRPRSCVSPIAPALLRWRSTDRRCARAPEFGWIPGNLCDLPKE